MPLPKITDKIINSTKSVIPGWNLLRLIEAPRANVAKSGEGVNYFFDFECVSGPNSSDENAGRRVTLVIFGKALEAGVGEVCATYYGCLCALTGASLEEIKDREINEALLVGKQAWADVQDRIVDGKTYKDFRQFSPANEIPY